MAEDKQSKKDKAEADKAQAEQQEEELTWQEQSELDAQDKIARQAEERGVPDPVKSVEADKDIQKPPTTADQRLAGIEVQNKLSEEQGQAWPPSPDLTQPIPSNAPLNPPQPDEEVTEEAEANK